MANNLNLCQFIGNLGADPETRYMPNGDPVTNFSLACNRKSSDKEGTEWVRVTAFGKLAEIIAQYVRKGSKVYVSGRMRTRSWEKDGQKQYSTEIVADKMEMLDSRQDGGSARPASRDQGQQQRQAAPQRQAPAPNFDDPDSIPF